MTALLIVAAWNLALATALAAIVALLCLVPAIARRPALRHTLWLLVLVKLVTPPLVPLPILPVADSTQSASVDVFPTTEITADLDTNETVREPAEPPITPAWPIEVENLSEGEAHIVDSEAIRERPVAALRPTLPAEAQVEAVISAGSLPWRSPGILLPLSLLGTIVIFGRGWARASRLSQVLQRAGTRERLQVIVRDAASTMRVARTPKVSVVDAHVSPLLWVGWNGPIIVLPARLVNELNDEQLLDIVRHEIAHYVRRDHWSNGLAFAITALWWWHPVAWWTRNRLRTAQELCCDAMVVDGSATARRRYAETLLKVLDFLQSGKPVLPAVGTGFGGSHPVKRRFEMIADEKLSYRWSRWAMLVVICAAALLPCMPTTRAQDDRDDSPPAESGANDHHDPSQHSAIDAGGAAFVREVIGRYDPDFWQMEEEIIELHRAGLAVLSPEQDWLALVRDGQLVVIEVRTGHVAQREGLRGEADKIEWVPDGVRVAMADGGELRFDVIPQVMRVRDADGGPATINSIAEAHVGYSGSSTGWSTWPARDGSVSLVGLSEDAHWLVVLPRYDPLKVELPLEDPPIERTLRPRVTLRSTNISTKPSVRWDEQDGDVIRVEIENRTGDVFRISEQDLRLEAGVSMYNAAQILSPWWASGEPGPAPEVTIDHGQTGQIEINWREWVRDGLWLSSHGIDHAGPALPDPEPGRMWVRVWARQFGTLPVAVTHPMNEMSAVLQGTWRLISTETLGVGTDSEQVTYDTAFSEQPHMQMAINGQMIAGVPLIPLDTPLRLRPSGTGMLSDSDVKGMYTLDDAASPKTLAVELFRRTGTWVETERRACIYRCDEAASQVGGRVLVLAFNPENPDKPPTSWDRGPLAIFRFHQPREPESADDDIGGEHSAEIPDAAAQPQPRDMTLEGSLVTPEAIERLADRNWDTVALMDAQFDGAIIERLRHAGSIHTLRLYGNGLSGQVPRLEHVAGLVALEMGAALQVRDLQAIGNLTQLERLTLPQELALTVTGARQIARLTDLKSLGLYNVDVDDASFAELGTLVNLEVLDLSHTRITDDGLQVLARMPRLKSLELSRHPEWHIPQQITDASVPIICQLTELERLSLSGDVTDEGLISIAALPRLKHLSILNTRITDEGLAALEESNVESLMLELGQLGSLPMDVENHEQLLRLVPALDSIRKNRHLKVIWVYGESSPGYDYEALQRLAPNVDWGFSS